MDNCSRTPVIAPARKRFCLFADTENIGWKLPESRMKHVITYYYTTTPEKSALLPDFLSSSHFHITNLENILSKTRSELDMIILIDLALRLQKDSPARRSQGEYIILSKDKGYDGPLRHLQALFPEAKISRLPLTLPQAFSYIEKKRIAPEKLPELIQQHPALYEPFCRSTDYAGFRSGLRASAQKSLRILWEASFPKFWIEYDFFADSFLLFESGALTRTFDSFEQAANALQQAREQDLEKQAAPNLSADGAPADTACAAILPVVEPAQKARLLPQCSVPVFQSPAADKNPDADSEDPSLTDAHSEKQPLPGDLFASKISGLPEHLLS